MVNTPFSTFERTATFDGGVRALPDGIEVDGFRDFAAEFSGAEFNGGLYRVHTQESGSLMDWVLRMAMPTVAGMAFSLASDWVGRQYCVLGSSKSTEVKLRMFDPATCQVFAIPKSIEEFHATELHDIREEVLTESFLSVFVERQSDWQGFGQKKCAGLKQPLQLGGKEHVDNLELIDMEVYWDFQAQIAAQTKDLKPGTKISGVTTTPPTD